MDEKQQPQDAPEAKASPSAPEQAAAKAPAEKATPAPEGAPVASPAEAKPAAKPAPKAAPVKAPAVMQATPWEGEIPEALQARFGERLLRAATYRGQDFLEVKPDDVPELIETLRDEFDYDYLVEETAVDYPKDDQRFEVVYILYSFSRNHRIRVKTRIAASAKMPTVVPLFASANWMEREIFDMFGIEFAGHPDLRRILMPDEWEGHPLRKDYGIIQQDTRWVQENLEIESGQ